MRWRRRADLHEDQSWRLQVYNFLTDDAQQIGMQEKTLSWGGDLQRDDSSMTKDSTLVEGLPLLKAGIKHQVLTIGCTRAIMIHDVFKREVHQCVKSSFKDYERNVCWICMESAEAVGPVAVLPAPLLQNLLFRDAAALHALPALPCSLSDSASRIPNSTNSKCQGPWLGAGGS